MSIKVVDFTLDGENNVLLTVAGDFALVEAIDFEGRVSMLRQSFKAEYKDDKTGVYRRSQCGGFLDAVVSNLF